MYGALRIAAAVLLCSASISGSAQTRSGLEVATSRVSPEQTRAIDRIIRREMQARHIAGAALAITDRGRLIYAQGYGLVDVGAGRLVKYDTRFPIASVTKKFTAIATMMLVEDRKLSLDGSVSGTLSNVPRAWRDITVRQLLTHTAGVPSLTRFDALQCPQVKAEAYYAAEDVIEEVA